MKTVDIKINDPFGNNEAKLSISLWATAGEIICSLARTNLPVEDYVAKASSPVYNLKNTAVAFVRSFGLAGINFLTLAVVNTSSADASGRIEIASHVSNPNAGSKVELDEELKISSGAALTYHILVSTT
jgi:hypothetical protein